jgi:hypothetical protein
MEEVDEGAEAAVAIEDVEEEAEEEPGNEEEYKSAV